MDAIVVYEYMSFGGTLSDFSLKAFNGEFVPFFGEFY